MLIFSSLNQRTNCSDLPICAAAIASTGHVREPKPSPEFTVQQLSGSASRCSCDKPTGAANVGSSTPEAQRLLAFLGGLDASVSVCFRRHCSRFLDHVAQSLEREQFHRGSKVQQVLVYLEYCGCCIGQYNLDHGDCAYHLANCYSRDRCLSCRLGRISRLS
jgi:hypothetical protein